MMKWAIVIVIVLVVVAAYFMWPANYELVNAKWGADQSTWIDVTNVAKSIFDPSTGILTTNQPAPTIFGDPAPNVVKTLKLLYKKMGTLQPVYNLSESAVQLKNQLP